MRYAVIENDIVANIIEADTRGAQSLSDFMVLVNTDDRPVAIGDQYENGRFYRDGEEVLTQAEKEKRELEDRIKVLESKLSSMGY